MGTVVQDVRETIRGLRKRPGFAAATILIIGLGIAANTTVFSVLYGVLLAPLPYPEPDRLTFISSDLASGDYLRRPLSGPEVGDLRRGAPLHESIGSIWPTWGTLIENGQPQPLRIGMVTSNFLTLFGVPAAHGRIFSASDEGVGTEPSIVLSGGLWQSRFGGADVVGRTLEIHGGWGLPGGTYRVIGVMPADFQMRLPVDSSVPATVDGWVTFQWDVTQGPRGTAFLRTIGRLAPGVNMRAAQDQIEAVGRDMIQRNPEYGPAARRFSAVPLHEDLVAPARPALLVLQGAALVVLLIVCANVASLQLVRAQSRQKEIGIRAALGAPRRRLAQLLLIENLLLALAGGAVGVGLSELALRVLPALAPASLPRVADVALSGPVLAASLLAALACGILLGLAPLLALSRVDVVNVLKSGSQHRLPFLPHARGALVVAELCLAVVLLTGAGLLVRTFVNLQAVDPGYRAEDVLTFQLALPQDRYQTQAHLSRFSRTLEAQLRALPNVRAAGVVNQLPLDEAPNWATAYWTREDPERSDAPEADARLVSPGYLEALQTQLAAGRAFEDGDDETQPLVLIVDERLAQKTWPGSAAVDRELSVRVWTGRGFERRWGRVVGVVRHLRHHRLSEEVRGQVFIPFAQAPRNQMSVVVRSTGDPTAMASSVRQQVAAIDPALAPLRMMSLGDYVSRSLAMPRVSMLLSAVLAGFSLLLGAVGVYGVVSYSVAQRSSELGVRAALGAERSDLVGLVARQGARLIGIGVVLGLIVSVGAARALKTMLFGVNALDPLTFIGVPIVLGLTALLASYVPARRAAKADPAMVLRNG